VVEAEDASSAHLAVAHPGESLSIALLAVVPVEVV